MKNEDLKQIAVNIRQKATELLKDKQLKASRKFTKLDSLKLIYELEVHQIELELINEELQIVNEKLELNAEKYTDLYDFAASGYYTLSNEGIISELNLQGAKILNKSRSELINSNFTFFISYETKPIFIQFLEKIFSSSNKETCDVTIYTNSISETFVHLSGIRSENYKDCFITAIDITERKLAEIELSKVHEQLKQLLHHEFEIRESERKNISREIHDELGQSLSALKIDLGFVKDNVNGNININKKINSMIDIVSNTISNVQRISAELRPGILDDLGLIPAMEWYCQEFEKRTNIKCSYKPADIVLLNNNKILTLYRVLQEALTNVIRHSEANEVTVNYYKKKDSIILEIKDNGIGINSEKINSGYSLGILGMRERASQFYGKLHIASAKGKGTELIFELPFDKNEIA